MKTNIDLLNSQVSWLRYDQEIPFELEDSFIWFLSDLEINRFSFEYHPDNKSSKTLFIWLPINKWSTIDQENLANSLTLLAKPFGFTLLPGQWIQVKEEDWSLSWKKHWQSDPIGSSILILPAWLEAPAKFSDRKIVRLDPGSSFGTGSHPTTRLCLEAMDKNPPIGKSIADLGCGSGILSLTALRLGARRIFSVDTDSLAISAAKNNCSLNNFSESLFNISLGSIEELHASIADEKIDLMFCNILTPVIKLLSPSFEKIIGYKGKVILSGFLIDQVSEIKEFLYPLGWIVLEVNYKDQWASMVLTR